MVYLLYSSRDAPKYLVEWEINMNTENMNAAICCFCETIIAERIDYSKTMVCLDCNEYKSIMTVGEYLQEYGMVNA
jgi:hypothetical protein